MKLLKVTGRVLAVLVVAASIAWLFRHDPIGPLSGRQLIGPELPYPDDWSFTDDYLTIAVESRPDDPHSVTTLCFVHEGSLYVPAGDGADKQWPHFVVADSRIRLKVGENVYPASALRVTDADPADFLPSATAKYAEMAERMGDFPIEGIWLFRIGPRKR
jgi:hypothetical protein